MESSGSTPAGRARICWGSLTIFLVVALGGAWLVNLPTWLSGQGLAPGFTLYATAMMFCPSLAVLAVWLVARRRGVTVRDLARATGLGLGPRKRRTLAILGAAWVGVPLFVAVSLLASAAAGLYDLGFDLGLFRESMAEMPLAKSGLSAETLAVLTLGQIVVAPVLNAVPTLGEEWGWRGWLMPRLLVYGRWRAIAISGAIWGIWHAPLTLLGYNYADLGPWAAAMFIPFCVLFGAVLSWTRLTSGSVWPAVVGHAALNGSTPLIVLGAAAGADPNLALAGPIGAVGMVLLAAIVAALYRTTRWAAVESAGNVSTGTGPVTAGS